MTEKDDKNIKSNSNSNDLNKSTSNEIENINVEIIEKEKPRCNAKKYIILISIILLILMVSFLIIFFLINKNDNKEEEEIIAKTIDKENNISEEKIKIAKYNTVIKLNDIKLPTSKYNYNYNEEYLNSFYNFTINFFEIINYTDYSPITLYSVLINLYMSISDNEELEKLNEILGLNHDERLIFYNQIFQNNYFSNSDGEIKITNGAFYNSDKVKENKTFIKEIKKTYTECYKLSYKKDFDFILDWIDNSIKEKNFIEKSKFENINDIAILLISSLYYKQKWRVKFVDATTYKDKFYINETYYKEVDFMRHSYSINYYYDYGNYISFYDFYSNEYSIQYLIPKSISSDSYNIKPNYSSNILNLIKDINFLEEDKSKIENITLIDLSVPKFKKETEIDFIPVLKKLGLEKLFDKSFSTIENPFIVEKNYNYYVNNIFQKNKIELNEDGTTIKSVAIVEIDSFATSAPPDPELVIKLNQPFIYIIKDKNKLPIYIGYINETNYDNL